MWNYIIPHGVAPGLESRPVNFWGCYQEGDYVYVFCDRDGYFQYYTEWNCPSGGCTHPAAAGFLNQQKRNENEP